MEDNFKDYLIRMKPFIDGGIASLLAEKKDLDEEVGAMLMKGKRLRGALLFYVADAVRDQNTPFPVKEAMDLAVAVELAHSASLILDDMLDEDCTRRGLPTLHLTRGQKQAMLDTIGVLTLPYDLAGEHGRIYTQTLAETQRRMASGVIREMVKKPDLPASRLYDTIITKKTGCLFGLATMWGYLIGHRIGIIHETKMVEQPTVMQAFTVPPMVNLVTAGGWRRWGIHVGKAMQIADDIADLYAIERDEREKKSWGSEALLLLLSADLVIKDLVSDLKDLALQPERAKLLLSQKGVKEALKIKLVEESAAAVQILMGMEDLSQDIFKQLGAVPFIIEDIMIGEVTEARDDGHEERESSH
jgi:geranylgeranyl diphosphate synthase type II